MNVGGTGKLAMSDLAALCVGVGFERVRTYIASGNVLFDSALDEVAVKGLIETALGAHAGRPVGVLVRTAEEMAAVVAANPFAEAPGNRVVAIFLDGPPPPGALAAAVGAKDERMALGQREIYVWYPSGQGDSKLRIPAAATGTARNLNTVAKLAELGRPI